MASRHDMNRLNELVKIIQADGPITKVGLVMKARMSISLFDKLRPFLVEVHQDKVQWDSDTKLWKSLSNVVQQDKETK